jgi:hypothetical protein
MPKAVTHSQEDSLLFQLPQELRDEIYNQVFSDTCISWSLNGTDSIPAPPQPHHLGLLRTCQRTKAEIGDKWLGQVLFSFEHPATMLDVLTDIPTETLSSIRQVKIQGDFIPLVYDSSSGRPPVIFYGLAAVLKLLPGLRLDQLIVTDPQNADETGSYNTLKELVTESSGWKELCYISDTGSTMLTCQNFRCPNEPKPHPPHWQRIMEERDGVSSKPSVTIYRAERVGDPTQLGHSNSEVRHAQNSTPDFGLVRYMFFRDDWEIRVIVKRGVGVDYEERRGSALLTEGDIRRDVPGDRTWKWIKANLRPGGDGDMYSNVSLGD